MRLEDYQKFTPTTAIYPKDLELVYLGLGLMAESREWRDTGYYKTSTEIGDIFWYCSQICNFYERDLNDVWSMTDALWSICRPFSPNLPDALKKHIRDGKNIESQVVEYMLLLLFKVRHITGGDYDTIKSILDQNYYKLIGRQQSGTLKGDGEVR